MVPCSLSPSEPWALCLQSWCVVVAVLVADGELKLEHRRRTLHLKEQLRGAFFAGRDHAQLSEAHLEVNRRARAVFDPGEGLIRGAGAVVGDVDAQGDL